MSSEMLKFGNIGTESNYLYCYKSPVPLRDVDI